LLAGYLVQKSDDQNFDMFLKSVANGTIDRVEFRGSITGAFQTQIVGASNEAVWRDFFGFCRVPKGSSAVLRKPFTSLGRSTGSNRQQFPDGRCGNDLAMLVPVPSKTAGRPDNRCIDIVTGPR